MEPAGFSTVPTTARQTSAPIVDCCLSWFDCTVEDVLPGGDHEILVGRVARPAVELVSLSSIGQVDIAR